MTAVELYNNIYVIREGIDFKLQNWKCHFIHQLIKYSIAKSINFLPLFFFFFFRTSIKNQYLEDIKSELAKIPNIDKKLVDLKEEKDIKQAELKQIKDVSWFSLVY